MKLTCQKRREIVRRERDGSTRKLHRCAHGMAVTYRQEVGEDVCSGCVLRQVVPGKSTCNPKPPVSPTYNQPTYGQNTEIRYKPVDAEPPECPEGYKRRTNDDWIFDSIWFPCPYRAFNDDLKPSGELQVRAYCTALKKKATCEGCDQCKGELVELGGTFDPSKPPETPGLAAQAQTYWKAIKRWIAAGRPTRSDDEIKRLHANFCSKCDWYDREQQRCKGCGCKVMPSGFAMLNKIKMATEHCPRDFW